MSTKATGTFDLTGRVAWITGAGRGIGAEIARTLARAGAAVAVNDLFAERAEETAAAINAAGLRACAAAGDVTDAEAVARLVRDVARVFGPVDVPCTTPHARVRLQIGAFERQPRARSTS
jgi:NAD(P)-dependent dehydrogenase (short-subunit alcohol dehydrogenase family)